MILFQILGKTRQILSNKLYTHVINTISELDYNENDWYFTIKDYNDVEEEIFKIINKISSGKEVNFTFDENSITFVDYDFASIGYIDFLDYLVIYDRFSNQDIFDGKYSNMKNIPNLMKREYAEYQTIERGENYYLDVSLFDDYFSTDALEGKSSKPLEFVKEKIQDFKKIATENPNIFYVFNGSYNTETEDHFDDETDGFIIDDYVIYENSYSYETTKEFFDTEMYPDILKTTRGVLDEYDIVYLVNNLFADYLYNYSANEVKFNKYYYYEDSNEIILDETY